MHCVFSTSSFWSLIYSYGKTEGKVHLHCIMRVCKGIHTPFMSAFKCLISGTPICQVYTALSFVILVIDQSISWMSN